MRRLTSLLCVLFLALTAALHSAPASADSRAPVIFVHGFMGKGGQWNDMRAALVQSGYPEDRLHVFSYDWARSNTTIARQLADRVDSVRGQHGADRVHLVTHSMGGLSSRYYIKNLGGAETVDQWISIGGPNNGTKVASFCPSLMTPCKEMRHGSSFLNDLNGGDATPGPVTYTTMRSSCDLIISPTSSTSLPGANNIQVGCVEHISMMWNRGVIDHVRGVLG